MKAIMMQNGFVVLLTLAAIAVALYYLNPLTLITGTGDEVSSRSNVDKGSVNVDSDKHTSPQINRNYQASLVKNSCTISKTVIWDSAKLLNNTVLNPGFHASKIAILPVPKVVYYSSSGINNARNTMIALGADLNYEVFVGPETSDPSYVKAAKDALTETLTRFCRRSVAAIRSTSTGDSSSVLVSFEVITTINVFIGESGLLSKLNAMKSSVDLKASNRNETDLYSSDSIDKEEYILEVAVGSTGCMVNIYVTTTESLRLALASLSQMLASPVLLPPLPLAVHDWPSNAWRGLLIDVSRHFYPVALLKRSIDGMEISKFNVLHLHLTDSQSFPVLLDDVKDLKLSDLAKKGAFDQTKMYTKRDLEDIVSYASDRNIRVIPEIDLPAHTLSWGKSFPELIVDCQQTAARAQTPHNIYAINPINNLTMKIVFEVLKQITEIFPSKYLHVGGDEVDLECWRESNEIMQYSRNHSKSLPLIFKEFEQNVFDIVRRLGKVPIVWEGVLDVNSLPNENINTTDITYNDATRQQLGDMNKSKSKGKVVDKGERERALIQPWKCWSGLAVRAATQAYHEKHASVMAACWYLDYNSDWAQYLVTDLIASAVSSAAPYKSKSSSDVLNSSNRTFAAHKSSFSTSGSKPDDINGDKDALRRNYFIGGEGAVWSENIDISNLECRIWPRAVSIASRLWGYELHQPVSLVYGAVGSQESARRLQEQQVSRSQRDRVKFAVRQKRRRFLELKNSLGRLPQRITRPGDAKRSSRRLSEGAGALLLTVEETRHLYASLIHFRYFIYQSINIKAASILLHYPVDSSEYANRMHHRGHGRGVSHNNRRNRHLHHQAGHKDLARRGLLDSTDPIVTARSNRTLNAANSSRLPPLGSLGQLNGGLVMNLGNISGNTNRNYNHPSNTDSISIKSSPSPITSPVLTLFSEAAPDEIYALGLVSTMTYKMKFTDNAYLKSTPSLASGDILITSRCEGIPEPIQRPTSSNRIKIAQLNKAAFGGGRESTLSSKRDDLLNKWMSSLATQGLLFSGFCELNGWHEMQSNSDLYSNVPKITLRASSMGFPYSHVFSSVQQPYNIGLISTAEFTVLGRYGPPLFQRGVLHVSFEIASSDNGSGEDDIKEVLHVFVCHLNAHSSAARLKESLEFAKIISPLLQSNAKVIVMGDFNTLSPWDKSEHFHTKLIETLNNISAKGDVLPHMRRKFMKQSSHSVGMMNEINYEPMDVFLKSGLLDVCIESCRQKISAKDRALIDSIYKCYEKQVSSPPSSDSSSCIDLLGSWSSRNIDPFSECMKSSCPYSEPTLFNPEWSTMAEQGIEHPLIRLDFILVSKSIVFSDLSKLATLEGAGCLDASVDISNSTKNLSDHFPVLASFPYSFKKSRTMTTNSGSKYNNGQSPSLRSKSSVLMSDKCSDSELRFDLF